MKTVADSGIELGEIELVASDSVNVQQAPFELEAFVSLLATIVKRVALESQVDQFQSNGN